MSVFAPEFELRVRARRIREERERSLPVLPPPPLDHAEEPLRVVFTGQTARGLRLAAGARRESAAVLAAAIVERALRSGAAEEMLAGVRAEFVASGHGRRPVGDGESLTLRQCAVLYLIGSHGGASGWCGWSAAALARLMPMEMSPNHVAGIVVTLVNRRLIERQPQTGSAPRPMRLTELGRAVRAELAGDFGDG